MFYIQTVTKKSKLGNTNHVTDFLEHNYMGSAEFEYGSLGLLYEAFQGSPSVGVFEHDVKSKGGKEAWVKFFVVTTPEGFESFKEKIPAHLDGTTIGRKAKDATWLWEKFNSHSEVSKRIASRIDGWLVVDDYINRSRREGKPIFFTTEKTLAKQFYLYCRAKPFQPVTDLRIGDPVVIAESESLGDFKVAGILEDDTIVLKNGDTQAHKPVSLVYRIGKEEVHLRTIYNNMGIF